MNWTNGVILTAGSGAAGQSLVWEIIRVAAALVLLLPLAYVCTRFYASKVRGNGAQVIQIIDQVVLGKRCTLILVRVQKRVFFLCIADERIVKLSEWEDDGSLAVLKHTKGTPEFTAALRQVLQVRQQGADKDEA